MTQHNIPQIGVDLPAFSQPWQAQLFALTVALNEAGHFEWSDWADAFSDRRVGAVSDGSDYFDHWLITLEGLLQARGIADASLLTNLKSAWQRAAQATPHGHAIELSNDPEAKD